MQPFEYNVRLSCPALGRGGLVNMDMDMDMNYWCLICQACAIFHVIIVIIIRVFECDLASASNIPMRRHFIGSYEP
jgi:hypothetical protein